MLYATDLNNLHKIFLKLVSMEIRAFKILEGYDGMLTLEEYEANRKINSGLDIYTTMKHTHFNIIEGEIFCELHNYG